MAIPEGPDYPRDGDEFCYVTQYHASEDDGDISSAPVVGLKFSGKDQLELVTASATDKIHKEKPKQITRKIVTFPRGVINMVLLRIQFHPTDGQIQFWLNGKEELNISGIGTSYNDSTGPYFKGGLYSSEANHQMKVFYFNLEIGRKQSLFSRLANPLPIQ